ncbi:MAG: threonine synthase [Chromatocurvus sp.]
MRYVSTRGGAPSLNFEEVLLTGLAADGGLYVPESLPQFSQADLVAMAALDYPALAERIIAPFVGDCIAREDLGAIVRDTYAGFRHPAIAPLVQMDHNQWLLELFHGPTLAFKDFALQLLGRLLDHVLKRRGQRVVIMGATSGDTGSAAIEGCRRCDNVDIFILHPHGRVSEVQRRQMTTVQGEGIHNLAVEGNFDDCQAMVKASFSQRDFLPEGRGLVAVNSINWARIMAQVVYYFYAALALGAPARPVSFSGPTGNFGDIFAGYLARGMGLPVDRLVIATNRNDVLHRIMTTSVYARQPLQPSLSPSMDISVSSNFERLLFDLYGRDGAALAGLMTRFDAGDITLCEAAMAEACQLFASVRVDDEATCGQIARTWAASGYLLDPHSAIGYHAALQAAVPGTPMVTLATAHPAKFPDAVAKAGVDSAPQLPAHLADLFERQEHYTVVANDLREVQAAIAAQIRQ